jgi:hypothetical protein
MQKKIMVVDPMAFVYTDTQNLVASEPDYPMPVNSMFEIGVYLKASATAAYGWLDYIELPHLQMESGAYHTNPYTSGYSRKGRYIVIYPTPSSALAAGIKLEYIPWLTMGADTDVPEIDMGLHEGIAYRAEMIALGDTAQESVKAKEDLEAVVSDVPLYYRRRGGRQLISPPAGMTSVDYES